jgi:hypothetical protein
VAVGALLGATGLIDAPTAPATLTPLVEIALVWILLSDAAGCRSNSSGATRRTGWVCCLLAGTMLVLVGSFNAIAQLAFLFAYPLWGVILIIWALIVHGGEVKSTEDW